jgi:uncharacterized protein (TIGR01370 family)
MRKHLRPLLWALTALAAARMFIFLTGDANSADRRPAPQVKNWVCYYGAEDKTKDLARFDLAVLDPSTPLPPRNASGWPIRLGYVSVGEVAESAKIYGRLKNKRFLVSKNENWKSRVVDARALGWRQALFGTLVPEIYAKGFDGVFLDTMDSSLELERNNPKYKGMSEALVKIVKTLRDKNPNGYICQNRGFEILEKTAPYIDFVLVESLYYYVDFEANKYLRTSDADREFMLAQVAKAKAVNPSLLVLTLEYVQPGETGKAKEAIAFSRKHDFVPYVSTHELDKVFTSTLGR